MTEPFLPKSPSVLKQVWTLLRLRKKLWLLPLALVMILVGVLLSTGGPLSPLIYTLF